MDKKIKASEYNEKGYNCAESIIKAYNEEFDTDIPVSLGSGLGAGLTVGSICGAVNAASLIIGYTKGRNDETEMNNARAYTKKLMSQVKEKYNSDLCRDLKRNKVSCKEIIDFSYENLKEILK